MRIQRSFLLAGCLIAFTAAPVLAHSGHAHDASMSISQIILHLIIGVDPRVTIAAGVTLVVAAVAWRVRRRRLQ